MINKLTNEIFCFFPEFVKEKSMINSRLINKVQEIRIRIGQPICIRTFREEEFFSYIIKSQDILKILENFCNNSIYSVQNEINSGFITINGGHRVGITGTCVFENNMIKNIKHISSLNIRVAREVIGCADEILRYTIKKRKFDNTLILSPPGCGKTTLIRDMIRQLSNGNEICNAYNVGLVDERSEIAAMYKGVPQNDIGRRTDVMNNCYKDIGMKMIIRSMGPQIVATDEIGRGKKRRSYI